MVTLLYVREDWDGRVGLETEHRMTEEPTAVDSPEIVPKRLSESVWRGALSLSLSLSLSL